MSLLHGLRRAVVVLATIVALGLGGVALAPAASAATAAPAAYSSSHNDRYSNHKRFVCKKVWKRVGYGKHKKWKTVIICFPVRRYDHR